MQNFEFTLLIEKAPDTNMYVGQLLEYPEVVSEAETIEQLKENIIEAFELLISNSEYSLPTSKLLSSIEEARSGNINVMNGEDKLSKYLFRIKDKYKV